MRTALHLFLSLACLSALGGELKFTPAQLKGIKAYATEDHSGPKEPGISIMIAITRKTQEEADPAKFTVTVKDSQGKELTQAERKTFITGLVAGRPNGVVQFKLKPAPGLPLTVLVKDPQEEKELEFQVKPEEKSKRVAGH